ncbi:DinB superfamily protein [Jatrophihabitans endophyticus]|uniref:DinB superfamily protein n=1 Tax=Jatrophihabitans endophyticus TaxID=1206085 RepID=A0A1M5C1D7_9ACTN|nr:DinB family protein [Jatrophihabitans endophyticus]SHF48485.1 DinB superfamily protein [Jatrophihabitans endophyticus]
MPTTSEDVRTRCDHAWARVRHRLLGLTDDEWRRQPGDDPDLGLRRRLDVLAAMLRDPRNATLLGRAPGAVEPKPAADAGEAVAQLEAAYAEWRGHLVALDDAALRVPVGPAGGEYAGGSRLAFALHVLDELVGQGAAIGLLRDLYAAGVDPR